MHSSCLQAWNGSSMVPATRHVLRRGHVDHRAVLVPSPLTNVWSSQKGPTLSHLESKLKLQCLVQLPARLLAGLGTAWRHRGCVPICSQLQRENRRWTQGFTRWHSKVLKMFPPLSARIRGVPNSWGMKRQFYIDFLNRLPAMDFN